MKVFLILYNEDTCKINAITYTLLIYQLYFTFIYLKNCRRVCVVFSRICAFYTLWHKSSHINVVAAPLFPLFQLCLSSKLTPKSSLMIKNYTITPTVCWNAFYISWYLLCERFLLLLLLLANSLQIYLVEFIYTHCEIITNILIFFIGWL